MIKDAAGMYSYIPKQAQVRIRFMSFYNVYTFLICHMGREMSFSPCPGCSETRLCDIPWFPCPTGEAG
ncbi:hypothetical protein M083_1782 [Bacteroides fragilis str. 3986 T(B)9]|nr:hypothetical protein M083_1782 [Bacteroides fragilis str. 3986 T(B)9]